MTGAGGDGDRVARADGPCLGAEGHVGLADEDVIDLLGHGMVMGRGRTAAGEPGLGEALLADRRVAVSEQFADRGAVDRGERLRIPLVDDVHRHPLALGGPRSIATRSLKHTRRVGIENEPAGRPARRGRTAPVPIWPWAHTVAGGFFLPAAGDEDRRSTVAAGFLTASRVQHGCVRP